MDSQIDGANSETRRRYSSDLHEARRGRKAFFCLRKKSRETGTATDFKIKVKNDLEKPSRSCRDLNEQFPN